MVMETLMLWKKVVFTSVAADQMHMWRATWVEEAAVRYCDESAIAATFS